MTSLIFEISNSQLIEAEKKLPGVGVWEMERWWSQGKKFHLCKMNKLWRSNVQHGDYS